MKYFLDSAITGEIAYALDMLDIDGVTTNPRHVQASGKPFMTVIQEIGKMFAGTDKPVSVEVNPHLTDWRAMVAEGEKLAALCPNFVIKLPATEPGFKSVAVLKEKGIRSNLTLVFSASQALQAMRMGAAFVSPFIGWKESNGEESVALHPGCRGDPRQLRLRDRDHRRGGAHGPPDRRIGGGRRGYRHCGVGGVQGCLRPSVYRQGAEAVPGFLGSDEVRVMRET